MTLPPGPPAAAPAFAAPTAFRDSSLATPPPRFARPTVVTILAVLDIIAGLLYLAGGTLVGVLALAGQIEDAAIAFVILGGFAAALGALYLATGLGLWVLKPFGRTCQFLLALFWLLSIPLGTIIGAMTMYYLTRPGVALLFSAKPPAALTPAQRATVDRDARGGALLVALVVCVGLGAVAFAGIAAAIAIPALLSARMGGNEVVAIGRLRGMASAQAVYAVGHDGQYGTLDCLNQPATCPPTDGRPPSTPYLSAEFSGSPASGYTFQLVLSDDRRHYTYWAEPERHGTSGRRAFCLEPSGIVVQYETTVPGAPAPGETCPGGGEPVM